MYHNILPKEEEVPIASPIEDQSFDEHVEEESLHEYHDPITCTPFQTLRPLDASFENLEREKFVEESLEKEKPCGSINLDKNLECENNQFYFPIHMKLRT
jgi:hypothetical protein